LCVCRFAQDPASAEAKASVLGATSKACERRQSCGQSKPMIEVSGARAGRGTADCPCRLAGISAT